MAKDPAFLFYSRDFYEGTRTMLPEERACFIDLMIYQHQRGPIPNDLKRVLLYCNGVDEATLKATLQAKFKLTSEGWINEKLAQTIEERKEYTEGQSKNGTVGQFWKKSKAILSKKEYNQLRDLLYNQSKEQIFEIIKDKIINEATLKAMLEGSLKHIANANENENENEDINIKEGVKGEKQVPPTPATKTLTWRDNFETYLSELNEVYDRLICDPKYISEQEEFHPGVDIVLSLKKAYTNFWGKEAGWKYKKKQKSKNIDWVSTLTNAIDLNKVYKAKESSYPKKKGTSLAELTEIANDLCSLPNYIEK